MKKSHRKIYIGAESESEGVGERERESEPVRVRENEKESESVRCGRIFVSDSVFFWSALSSH